MLFWYANFYKKYMRPTTHSNRDISGSNYSNNKRVSISTRHPNFFFGKHSKKKNFRNNRNLLTLGEALKRKKILFKGVISMYRALKSKGKKGFKTEHG